MTFARLFPRALAVCLAIGAFSTAVQAQEAARPYQAAERTKPTTVTSGEGRSRLETDVMLVSEADEVEPADDVKGLPSFLGMGGVERLMMESIEEKIGTPYRLGTEGPYRFDCSGFVWSVFREAGISFDRGTARAFWSQFEPVDDDEKFKFGTLVFFNHLGHVGIVADENGFYHASSSRGVTYSRFNDYWTRRITGFRRVPLTPAFVAAARR
ncbi:MAG TPA: C40 family peptidase [Pyrinomonadaceae bacterium]|nr:C40 family peptidase [Pyrinomonadaceae bacterium]